MTRDWLVPYWECCSLFALFQRNTCNGKCEIWDFHGILSQKTASNLHNCKCTVIAGLVNWVEICSSGRTCMEVGCSNVSCSSYPRGHDSSSLLMVWIHSRNEIPLGKWNHHSRVSRISNMSYPESFVQCPPRCRHWATEFCPHGNLR
jgi:hypothetical protein